MADASAFLGMARRVEAVEADEFAGAVVIVPPGDDAKAIEFVTSDPNPDLIQFWASIKSRVEVAYAEAVGRAEQSRGGGGW